MLCSRPGKSERDILRESETQNSLLATVITRKSKPLEAPARWNLETSSHGSSER